MNNEEDFDTFPMAYSIDNAILMHKDAHFGGDFTIMIDYYEKQGKGISQDFDTDRIQELYEMEKKTGQNLSALMLSGPEAEQVMEARNAYKKLREVYEKKLAKDSIPLLIADLILAEEEETEAAIAALVEKKSAAVPALLELLKNEEYHNPLFPGYGQAPALAAKCLGLIGDKKAIIALFESIGSGDFFDEGIILESLRLIGQPAKEFLLKVLHGRPITMDNEQAAIALIHFKDDPEVGKACVDALRSLDLKKHAPLATYLVLASEGVKDEVLKNELLAVAENPDTPKTLRQDIKEVSKSWV